MPLYFHPESSSLKKPKPFQSPMPHHINHSSQKSSILLSFNDSPHIHLTWIFFSAWLGLIWKQKAEDADSRMHKCDHIRHIYQGYSNFSFQVHIKKSWETSGVHGPCFSALLALTVVLGGPLGLWEPLLYIVIILDNYKNFGGAIQKLAGGPEQYPIILFWTITKQNVVRRNNCTHWGVESVNKLKFLRVMFQSNFSIVAHVKEILTKSFNMFNMFPRWTCWKAMDSRKRSWEKSSDFLLHFQTSVFLPQKKLVDEYRQDFWGNV